MVNVPFKEHIGDDDWVALNRQMIGKLVNVFNPDVFVVLAGADSLYNDDHKALKITQPGYLKLMAYIQSLNRRMLVLGGGGYNEPAWGFLCIFLPFPMFKRVRFRALKKPWKTLETATAKLWTLITAQLCSLELPDDIPDEYDYFNDMGPDFTINDTDTPGGVQHLSDIERADIVRHVTLKCNQIRKDAELVRLPSRPFRRRKLSLNA